MVGKKGRGRRLADRVDFGRPGRSVSHKAPFDLQRSRTTARVCVYSGPQMHSLHRVWVAFVISAKLWGWPAEKNFKLCFVNRACGWVCVLPLGRSWRNAAYPIWLIEEVCALFVRCFWHCPGCVKVSSMLSLWTGLCMFTSWCNSDFPR